MQTPDPNTATNGQGTSASTFEAQPQLGEQAFRWIETQLPQLLRLAPNHARMISLALSKPSFNLQEIADHFKGPSGRTITVAAASKALIVLQRRGLIEFRLCVETNPKGRRAALPGPVLRALLLALAPEPT